VVLTLGNFLLFIDRDDEMRPDQAAEADPPAPATREEPVADPED